MALKKFARRDVILPAVVFLLTFAVALFKSGRPCITKTAPPSGVLFLLWARQDLNPRPSGYEPPALTN